MIPFNFTNKSVPSIISFFEDSNTSIFVGIFSPSISKFTITFPSEGTFFPLAIVNIILLPSSISIPNSSCNFCDIILVAAPVSIIAPVSCPLILILLFTAKIL